MATRIPHLLDPYLTLPPECAHIVLTNVLGASSNWLILRYLFSYLQRKTSTTGEIGDGEDDQTVNVVLVSFMRDFAFWKDGTGRLGLDLEALTRAGRFAFVDGLTGLFVPPGQNAPASSKGRRLLLSPKLPDLKREILAAVSDVSSNPAHPAKTVLVVDQPDLLLAATADLAPEPPASTQVQALREALLDVQEAVHASVFAVAADEALVATQATGLEKEHAAFVLSLAHSAHAVIGLRLLDTGGASDVSGVLRATAGGGLSAGEDGKTVEEGEFLYFVGTDGGVKVFHRGQ